MGSAINPRIPIVDDGENVLEIATTLIRRLGYTALIASNGVALRGRRLQRPLFRSLIERRLDPRSWARTITS
jgi:hypothetical protein